MRAKKSLGQNFLTSKEVVEDIIKTACLSEKDIVFEIGPGKGFLTEKLLKKVNKVIAVEKDIQLVEYLQKKFEKEITVGKLTIIHGDILDFNLSDFPLLTKKYSLIANIPYYITGHILQLFLESEAQPVKMILMLQKQVAQRIVATDGKESILSISVKAYGKPKYIKKVPADYFKPKPKVDSAILLIDDISKNLFQNDRKRVPIIKEKEFFKLVKTGFAHKRKTLFNNLKQLFKKNDLEKLFKNCKIQPNTRAEELSVENWMCLYRKKQQN
jgi:16S rRNA (adenine1518-N6/adenine1519-N6)-dimethyltransferase